MFTTVHSAKATGIEAETIARDYLVQRGLIFIESQFYTKGGELDLVMRDQDTLVIVEVRYRDSDQYGSAEESITPHKKRKIIFATKCYLSRNPAWNNHDVRFDVVGITKKAGRININWLEHAFEVRS